MNCIIHDVAQRSPEWRALRVGKLTSTCACDMLSTIKSGEAAAGRRDLRTRIVIERLTGVEQEDCFVSADMRRGTELESEAIAEYEAASGVLVRSVGFISHAELPIGYSPDGVIGELEAVLEIKVPKSATHLRYLRSKDAPREHLAQITHALFITQAAFCDFVSYDPRYPAAGQLVIRRVRREDVDLAAYELVLRLFLKEIDEELASLQKLLTQIERAA